MSEIKQALNPFSTFAEHAIENVNGTWVWKNNTQNERICDWFGPSDFGAALSSAAVAEREPDSDRSFLLRNAVTRVSELEAEIAKLTKLLSGRDDFIVNQGLWGDLVATLPAARRVREGGKVDG